MALTASVVLCTYNGERFLGEQLDSLRAQHRPPDELVVFDDASSDGSRRLIEQFCATTQGLSAHCEFRRENVGFVRNFSDAIGAASGDVLFLCDQDDIWHADKLALMMARFEADPALVLLHSDARLVDAHGGDLRCSAFQSIGLRAWELQRIHAGDAWSVLLRRSMVTGATAGFRRDLRERLFPVGAGWIHDEWIAILAAVSGRVDTLERPLIDYRQHGGNQIGLRRRGLVDKWRDLRRPRRALMQHFVERATSLRTRLAELLPPADARLRQLDAYLDHFKGRLRIGSLPHWRRLPPVLGELGRGGYRTYGTGLRSACRDLLRDD